MLERSGTEKIPEVAPCFRSAAGLCHCTYHVGVDGCFKGCFDESSDLDAGLHAGGLGKLNWSHPGSVAPLCLDLGQIALGGQ